MAWQNAENKENIQFIKQKQGNETSEVRKGTGPWEEQVQSQRRHKKKFCDAGDNLFLDYNCGYLIEFLL